MVKSALHRIALQYCCAVFPLQTERENVCQPPRPPVGGFTEGACASANLEKMSVYFCSHSLSLLARLVASWLANVDLLPLHLSTKLYSLTHTHIHRSKVSQYESESKFQVSKSCSLNVSRVRPSAATTTTGSISQSMICSPQEAEERI